MEMSASEEIPLQGVDDKKVEVGKLVELQEQVAPQGTSPNTKGTGAQSQWLCKKIFTTVATLIAYAFLNVGISMIAPFYPIAVTSGVFQHVFMCNSCMVSTLQGHRSNQRMAQKYGLPVYYSGFVIGTAPLCMTVTSPFIGYLLPQLGLKFTQLAGLFLAGGSLILFGFVSMMETAGLFLGFSFVLRIVSGVGIAMFSTASYTLLTQFFATKKGSVVSIMEFSLILGYTAGPVIGGGLQHAGGFILPFLVVGGCTVAQMLLLMAVIPSTECTSTKVSWRLLLRLFSNIVFVLIVLILVMIIGAYCAAFSYFGQFIHMQFGLNVGLVGVTYCAITLAYAVGTILTGPITDRLKRPRYFIITGLVIAGAGFQFIGPAEFITSPKLWLSIIACLVMGVGSALSVVPVYPDIYGIAKTFHDDEDAIASILSGILVGSISAGEALGPIIGGGLVYKVGFQYMAAILGLVLLVNALVLIIATVIQRVWKSKT